MVATMFGSLFIIILFISVLAPSSFSIPLSIILGAGLIAMAIDFKK